MLELYYFPTSTCALKARLTLAEKGVAWTPRVLDRDAGDLNSPHYRALNPQGVVPTLVHDDRPLVESSVIMQYVDFAFEGPSLMPAAAFSRAGALLWMKRADEMLLPAIGTLTYALTVRTKLLRLPPARREAYYAAIPDPVRRARRRSVVEHGLDAPEVGPAAKELAGLAKDLDAALSHRKWLCGDTWSLADAAIGPFVLRLHEFGGLWLRDRKAVTRWWRDVRDRGSWLATAGRDAPDAERAAQMQAAGAASWPQLRTLSEVKP